MGLVDEKRIWSRGRVRAKACGRSDSTQHSEKTRLGTTVPILGDARESPESTGRASKWNGHLCCNSLLNSF